ncbi:MAG: sigma-70 family RNA polymerase sigma factor [Candidatus Sphingomonas colombiensis]|nr:sigma-70 family RNA polymerase sigma factor [Sphingomonas sp.]WEK43383.1 MAG: sigma-70 family RNA polymerase sigma factor [Sphingomonas sp.]
MEKSALAEMGTEPLSDQAFKEMLAAGIPHLRAFARSLCGDRDNADDLAQEAMLKAWEGRGRFVAGTNFRAWIFTILRNHYFSQFRRKRFVGEWNDLVAERVLSAPASQGTAIELQDLMRAIQQIPPDQREAVILVAACGMSYEEAAAIAKVAVGTIKSRVSRGRAALEAIMDSGVLRIKRRDYVGEGDAVVSLLAYLESRRAGIARTAGVIGTLIAA